MQLFLGWVRQYLVTIGYLYRRTTKRVLTPTFGGTSGSVLESSGCQYMGVSVNGGTPKSSILIGFSTMNHPFWCVSLFLETPIFPCIFQRCCWKKSFTSCFVSHLACERWDRRPVSFRRLRERPPGLRGVGCYQFFVLVATWQGGVNSWFFERTTSFKHIKKQSVWISFPPIFFGKKLDKMRCFYDFFLVKWSNKNQTAGYKFTWEACFVDLMA